MALYFNGKPIVNSLAIDGKLPENLVLSETATGQTYTFTNDFEGYVLIMGRDSQTTTYDAPTVSVQEYYVYFGNIVQYDMPSIQKTFIYCKAQSGDYITINDYYSDGEFYLFKSVKGDDVVIPLYTINQSQGGVWVSTGINASNIDSFLFVANDETVTGNYLMRQIPTSDIAVSSGGSSQFTTIFTSAEIGKMFNARIYNGILEVSFNEPSVSTRKVMICAPIKIE